MKEKRRRKKENQRVVHHVDPLFETLHVQDDVSILQEAQKGLNLFLRFSPALEPMFQIRRNPG